MLEYVSRPLEPIEDLYAERSGMSGLELLPRYVTPVRPSDAESDGLSRTLNSLFPRTDLPADGAFTDIRRFDGLRRAVSSAVTISAMQPAFAESLHLPVVTDGNADTYVSLLQTLMESGRRIYRGFPWYERWRKTRELSETLGPLSVASGTISPYPFNEDAYRIRELWGKGSYGPEYEGLFAVADGMVNRAIRNRHDGVRSLAGHVLAESVTSGNAGLSGGRPDVQRMNRNLFLDNMRHGRFRFIDRHGAVFTRALVRWQGDDPDAYAASVRFVHAGDTGAAIVGTYPGEEKEPRRIFSLPANSTFLGLHMDLPEQGVIVAETMLNPGDTLALWTDGATSLPAEVMTGIMGCRAATCGEILEMLLWGSVFATGAKRSRPDECTAIVVRMPS